MCLINDDPGEAGARVVKHRQHEVQHLRGHEEVAEMPRSGAPEGVAALERQVGAAESPGDGDTQLRARHRAPDSDTPAFGKWAAPPSPHSSSPRCRMPLTYFRTADLLTTYALRCTC